MTDSGIINFRSPIINEANLLPPSWMGGGINGGMHSYLRTPAGNVRAVPPPLPLAPTLQHNYGSSYGYGHNNNWCNGAFTNGGFGGYGYGNNFGSYGFGYNRFGNTNPLDPEARFIQLAETTSRPAFQSIESLVMAVGNIASMLDSTFFAITSSFRAILGVAANFGRLRGVFSQFWHTFAIFRTLNWIYRKLLYWLRISNLEPSSESFRKAYTEAINETSSQQGAPKPPRKAYTEAINETSSQQGAPKPPRKGQSPWPVLAFISFIFTAPYLIMKMLGTISNTAHEEACQPTKWIRPVETSALYDFQSRNSNELTIHAGQRLTIAPKEIQNTLGLLNTGWALATTNGQSVGIIPINYVKSPQQQKQEQEQQFSKPIATNENSLPTKSSETSITCKSEINLNDNSQSVDASVLPDSVKENI